MESVRRANRWLYLGFVSVSVSVSVTLSLCLCLSIWLLIPFEVSLRRAETEQLYQARRPIRGIGHMLFSIYSQTENVMDPRVSLVNLSGVK